MIKASVKVSVGGVEVEFWNDQAMDERESVVWAAAFIAELGRVAVFSGATATSYPTDKRVTAASVNVPKQKHEGEDYPDYITVADKVISISVDKVAAAKTKAGADYLRIMGGKWSKYGIPLWGEVWERLAIELGFTKKKLAESLASDSRWVAQVLLKADGSPKEVIGLIHASDPSGDDELADVPF